MYEIDYTPEWRKKRMAKRLNMEPFAFFRDDDVGYQNSAFRELAHYFLRCTIPLNVAVIPSEISLLDSETRDILSRPELFLMQHGHNHKTVYTANNGDHSEFHINVPKDQNRKKLSKGKRLFTESFNPRVLSFVPPRHGFPQIDLLIEEGYDLISGYGDGIEMIVGSILSSPVNLDIIADYEKGELHPNKVLIDHLKMVLERDGFVGVLLHHNFMPRDYKVSLDEILNALSKQGIPIKRMDHIK